MWKSLQRAGSIEAVDEPHFARESHKVMRRALGKMDHSATLLVLSDVHHASAAEQARDNPEGAVVDRFWLRFVARTFRRLWLGDLARNNYLLDQFVVRAEPADLVIANGDFSCDSAFVGVSDDASYTSAHECLSKLRTSFAGRFEATIGDHELGRRSLFGGSGGPRLVSWFRCLDGLKLRPFWQVPLGPYMLIGITSSLLALDAFEAQILPEERENWRGLREDHLCDIRSAFRALTNDRRILLFTHDPAALAWLAQEEAVRERFNQIEQTLVGHLHSRLVISGMRTLAHAGNSLWRDFSVRVCPALGCRPWPLGGLYYLIFLDLKGGRAARFCLQKLALRPSIAALM